MNKYWICWVSTIPLGEFELHSPWWVSGEDSKDRPIIYVAIQAEDEENAKNIIRRSYDNPPKSLMWRFVTFKPHSWSPFCDRFPKADWMKWE